MFKESPVKQKLRLVQDLKEKSAIGRTISLVEKRVSNDTSENPIRDLAFLSEQYHARGEWDKADADKLLCEIVDDRAFLATAHVRGVVDDLIHELDHRLEL